MEELITESFIEFPKLGVILSARLVDLGGDALELEKGMHVAEMQRSGVLRDGVGMPTLTRFM
jgi:hypothetical protein